MTIKEIKREIKQSFSKHFIMVFAFIFLYFFLVVGMPTPPGLIYRATDSYLLSLPGASDLRSGLLTKDMVTANVDMYNTYLLSAIASLIINLLLYFFLFILAYTLIWNLLQTNKISLRRFWRSVCLNIVWFVVIISIGFLFYSLLIFLTSFTSSLVVILALSIIFYLIVMFLILCTIIFNYQLHKQETLALVVLSFANSVKKLWIRLLVVQIILCIILFLVELLTYVPFLPYGIVVLILILVLLICVAWLHLYVATIISSATKKRSD